MLRANVAETVITPPVGTYMLEPSDTPTSGIHDDLYCRALAFDDGATQVAIVALDLLGVDAPLLQQIRAAVFAQTQLPPTHLMLTATHNHSAPVTLDCGLDDLRNRTWAAQLVDAVADCISSAMQNLQPVTLSVARGEGAIGVNRRVATMGRTRMLASPQGPVAPWVDVLSVQHEDGTLLALLFSHAAHPVTVHTASTEFNADYPGYAVQAVRQALGPDVMPMFAQGCAGDINVVSLAGGWLRRNDWVMPWAISL